MDGASIGHPCYEMVMGRQVLPSVKAVPACSQAGLVDGNRREALILNVYLSGERYSCVAQGDRQIFVEHSSVETPSVF